jgi:FtsH-binding integral membrane protein
MPRTTNVFNSRTPRAIWPFQLFALFCLAGGILDASHSYPRALPLIGAGLVASGLLWASVVYLYTGRLGASKQLFPALLVFLGTAALTISDSEAVLRALNL